MDIQTNASDGNTLTPTLLFAALRRLDDLLERAIAAAESAYGSKAAADPYRGLYIARDDVDRLLVREPGMPLLAAGATDGSSRPMHLPSLLWLQRKFALSAFDLDAILIALAPEVDLRYERLYAYLQDDVTRRRPSVDLVLNLLCATPDAKFHARSHFLPDAPLVRHQLVHLPADGGPGRAGLLARPVHLDESLVRQLLGQSYVDVRIEPFARIARPAVALAATALPEGMRIALAALLADRDRRPVRLYLRGPAGADQERIAEAIATGLGVPLLSADVRDLPVPAAEFRTAASLLCREALLRGAVLFLDGLDALHAEDRAPQWRALSQDLARLAIDVVLAGDAAWTGLVLVAGASAIDVATVRLPPAEFATRRAAWHEHMPAGSLPDIALDALAARFRLTPGQIAAAASSARAQTTLRSLETGAPEPVDLDEVFDAARNQSTHNLGTLARKMEPHYAWDDIILPSDQVQQLHEICNQVMHRELVFGRWGFDRKLSLGKGLNVLFSGPPGTGKTMAAEVIAKELRLDLFKIDLSQVVSKYIGETEKNLNRIFSEARTTNAILFFDEADALFGKRSEVRDAHDRYANIEIAYLLQKMEEYDGVSILATNLRQNLDVAFSRRLNFTVDFPFPDECSRLLIWRSMWPSETPLDPALDLDFVARQFKLSGGSIKNVAIAAAFLAADQGTAVSTAHVLRATRREFQKMGRTVSAAEFGGYADLAVLAHEQAS
jgi:ATP-dependent 26S proteasome regulatory subunit